MQDSKQIDELFRLMDDVCENGDAALPALEQYLQTQTDAPEIDTEASLKKFKADHKEFFVKPHRGAAAVLPRFCCRGGCFRRRNRICTGYRTQSVRLCSDVGCGNIRLLP